MGGVREERFGRSGREVENESEGERGVENESKGERGVENESKGWGSGDGWCGQQWNRITGGKQNL